MAGMVKAGKSTLLNAIIGEEIAPPTDAGECTRIVTWYRYGHTPRITLHPIIGGEPLALPVTREDGRLVFNMGDIRAEDVERLVVDWPSAGLRELTLIDTPGIASLSQDVSGRSTEFLPPRRRPPHGRRCRHLSPAASPLLRCPVPGILQGQHRGPIRGCQRLAVLSRADEIGAGRIDSLISAAVIADRYSRDQNLKPLALGVVPVAGLLAQSSRTMRQTDFEAMKLLAQMDRNQRERLMLSADLFVRSTEPEGLGRAAKASLVQRFGLFGIRLGVA